MLTVVAKDASTAMDEISAKLGADAMIISTRRVDNGVEVTATSDVIDLAQRVKMKSEKELFEIPSANSPKKTKTNEVKNTINLSNDRISSQQSLLLNEMKHFINLLEKEFKEVNKPNPHALSTAGRKTSRFTEKLEMLEANPNAIVSDMTNDLVVEAHDPLNSNDIYIIGASGVGKSTLASKICFSLKGRPDAGNILLMERNKNKFLNQTVMSLCATIAGQDYCDSKPKRRSSKCTQIIEMDAQEFCKEYQSKKMKKNSEVLLVVQAGINPNVLKTLLETTSEFNPKLVFSKLDECDISLEEVIEVFNAARKIVFFTSNKKMSEGLVKTTKPILNSFLSERLQRILS